MLLAERGGGREILRYAISRLLRRERGDTLYQGFSFDPEGVVAPAQGSENPGWNEAGRRWTRAIPYQEAIGYAISGASEQWTQPRWGCNVARVVVHPGVR